MDISKGAPSDRAAAKRRDSGQQSRHHFLHVDQHDASLPDPDPNRLFNKPSGILLGNHTPPAPPRCDATQNPQTDVDAPLQSGSCHDYANNAIAAASFSLSNPSSPSPSDSSTSTLVADGALAAAPRLTTAEAFQADLEALRSSQSSGSCQSNTATFYLPQDQLDKFEERVTNSNVSRVCYQFPTGRTDVVMGETVIHFRCSKGVTRLIERAIDDMMATVRTEAASPPVSPEGAETARRLASRLGNVQDHGTVDIEARCMWKRQPDSQFREVGLGILSPEFPCFVVETAFSEPASHVTKKAQSYIRDSKGQIRVVLVLDIQYPDASDINFSLWAADLSHPEGAPFLVQSAQLCGGEEQEGAEQEGPSGRILLFASDFLSGDALEIPAYLTRPSTAETTTTRPAQAEISLKQLRNVCISARRIHQEQQAAKEHREQGAEGFYDGGITAKNEEL
ncbi:hypothetical protein ColTof4_14430 [Colletotrichum tofieldiae]|nr:hypothetical protein ColTof3_14849 [Colletotrichum tofieldiae]GKT82007.1 hypothetical protein ColTof4_14430 [Colletotrichum tofieldiae]